MSARFSNEQSCEQSIDVRELPRDLRRMLSIQFREFVHHIEDAQPENAMEHSPRVVTFLERCYGDAA